MINHINVDDLLGQGVYAANRQLPEMAASLCGRIGRYSRLVSFSTDNSDYNVRKTIGGNVMRVTRASMVDSAAELEGWKGIEGIRPS